MVKLTSAPPAPGVRQTMAWLHTWVGLCVSWLLFAIFLTGTLAVFEEPITHWMRAEVRAAPAASPMATPDDRPERLAAAVRFLARTQPGVEMWEIWPANHNRKDSPLVAYWLDSRGEYESAELDPRTAAPPPPASKSAQAPPVRETLGGHYFVVFHYQLHAGQLGLWVVAIATVAMVVTLVSGVIIHKRIFRDFFTFRAGKGQRSWLDAHNTAAVLTLPFQFMIAVTGVAFYATTVMPAAVIANYGYGPEAERRYTEALSYPGKPARTGRPLAIPDLEPFARRAEPLMGQRARAVVIDRPGDAGMRICVYGWNEDDRRGFRVSDTSGMVSFAADGRLLQVRRPGGVDGGTTSLVHQVLTSLHMAGFGGATVKWLYFLSGAAGAAMMATGAILFTVKRRQKHKDRNGVGAAPGYRLVENLNVTAMAGLGVACIGYLWANRLIPVAVEHRAVWELRAFFVLWLVMLFHAFTRPRTRVWVEQLGLLAILCLLLPLVNQATVGDQFYAQIARGDWESAGVELMSLAIGATAAWAASMVRGSSTPTASLRAGA